MNYTTNYHLPQWVEEDRIMMEDFNEAMAGIDEGMSDNAAAAAELPYVVGNYVGNGSTQNISIGFMPSFLLVRQESTKLIQTDCYTNYSITGETDPYATLLLTEDGFQLIHRQNLANSINVNQKVYVYIAFR